MSTEYLYGWRFEPNDSGIPYLTYNFENPSIQIKQNFTIVSAQPSHASVIFGSSDATIHSNKQSNPLWRPPPHQHLKILGNNTSFTNQTLFAEEFQHTHNWIKNQCHLPRQAWNEKLASYTRRYEDCKLIHSNFNYNKNVFWTKFLQNENPLKSDIGTIWCPVGGMEHAKGE
ncbi:hypothetical protein JHK85_010871 [Glycine max]|nr:hypothetical protein JHK85_010871 [Glycine max]